jgi:hypothetical protein
MKSKKASSRVTSANQETAAAAGAARRSTKRKAIGSAAVENVQATISENGLQGDPGPHARERPEAAGQAGFPVRNNGA